MGSLRTQISHLRLLKDPISASGVGINKGEGKGACAAATEPWKGWDISPPSKAPLRSPRPPRPPPRPHPFSVRAPDPRGDLQKLDEAILPP